MRGQREASLAAPFIRKRQAVELVTKLVKSLPVVPVKDLNALLSDPCAVMPVFRAAGFLDGWAEAMPAVPANTAGQTDDLNNTPSQLDRQVDYVLHHDPGYLDAVPGSGAVMGGRLDDRTPSGLRPSDPGMALSPGIAKP